jgi:hypothetical protein
MREPEKIELFQITMDPLEAPLEGRYSKESNWGGQKARMKARSKEARLVSWRHTTSQRQSEILSLMEFHFFLH